MPQHQSTRPRAARAAGRRLARLGAAGVLATAGVVTAVASVSQEAVVYPATLTNYSSSVPQRPGRENVPSRVS